MPHFTLSLTQQSGALITVICTVSKERGEALTKAKKPIPPAATIRALIDTGASHTCVDPSIIKALSLTPTGSAQVHSSTTNSDPVTMEQYDVGLVIPGAIPEHIPFYLQTLPVLCTDLSKQDIQALIGRDILAHCVLTYNGSTGSFILAY